MSSKKIHSRSEFTALKEFSAGGSDAAGTLEKFTEPLRKAAGNGNEDEISDALAYEWKSILTVAENTTHSEQSHLIDFVTRLRKETLKSSSGGAISHEGGSIWTDLPTFGWQVREAWGFSPKQPGADEASKTPYVNQNAFLARLTNMSTAGDADDTLDFSLYALWSLREALEDDAPEETPGYGAIRAAAVWMIYSAEKIWQLSEAEKAFDGKLAKAGRKFKDEEWRGFNNDRWNVWKDEFRKLAKCPDPDATSLVQKALQNMENIQKS
ncbi:hypothetical protein EJ05DRAFT_481660 [Pseudovirgaria hyperparasitica]|uniref:Uncharacterized protein n=1 Tax=Pseudovirgaria hyperparasitica TaxID=470096 RepID=A0A6A6WKS9_9PEZI|nr:uncharacterized protein EJ05DRAFT_481660 [Pseudovirgaria hyperparasitica]KAF2762773.1 hypothetical protein EJ05DRAFT_481660 [Pseudovirgaria hyperparasitica]